VCSLLSEENTSLSTEMSNNNDSAVTPGIQRTALEAAQLNSANIKGGKIFLVTGAYSGLGVETTKALLHEGGYVIVANRNAELQKKFVEDTLVKEQGYDPAMIDGSFTLDLGDLASVKAFADAILAKYQTIDCLICNAGIMNTPPNVTKQGFEQQVGVCCIGHFLLAKKLAPITKRQVWVSSNGHRFKGGSRINIEFIKNFSMDNKRGYNGWVQYQQAKLGDILLAKEFDKRYSNFIAASLHPGAVGTNLARHMNLWDLLVFVFTIVPKALFSDPGKEMTFKTPDKGAATTVTVAAAEKVEPGAYYNNCEVLEPAACAKNEEDAKAFFDFCDEVTKAFQ